MVPSNRGSTDTTTSLSASQGRQCSRLTIDDETSLGPASSLAAPQKSNTTSLPEPEVANYHSSSRTTSTPNEVVISSEQKPKPSHWSVVYLPEIDRAPQLHLAHAFTYDSPVMCVKMSPDGQRLAVGLSGNGKTYLNESDTGSNVWLVS